MPSPAAAVTTIANGAVLVPSGPADFHAGSTATAQLLVERASYLLADAVFDYSPAGFGLGTAVRQWRRTGQLNARGAVPELYELETRAGAAAALLGFLQTAPAARVAVLASTGVLREMLPVLRANAPLLRHAQLVLHVAAVDFDAAAGALVADVGAALALGKELGFRVVASGLGTGLAGVENTAVLAAISAALGPVAHIYDGIRGTHQARTLTGPHPLAAFQRLAALDRPTSLSEAYTLAGAAFATKDIAPVAYTGPATATTAEVGFDEAKDTARGSVRITQLHPFPAEELVAALPRSVARLELADEALRRDLASALVVTYGPGRGPRLAARASAVAEPKIVKALVWDHDKAQTARAVAPLARAAAYVGLPHALLATHDGNVLGGAAEFEIKLGASTAAPLDTAAVAFVNALPLLKEVNVAARLDDGATLVLISESAEAADKQLTPAVKRALAAKHAKVYTFDLAALTDENLQGRSPLFGFQAAFWLLAVPELTKDQITSRIVHSNSQDIELIAATVDKLVDTIKEKALVALDTKDWATAEATPEDAARVQALPVGLVARSFAPTDEINLEQEAHTESLTLREITNRIVFPEAYEQSKELRPDLPTTNYIARVQVNNRVTPADYDRHIFHLELDITGTGLRYQIGEALGVHAPNKSEDVAAFIKWYDADPNEVIGVPSRDDQSVYEYKTTFQALRDNLDLFGKVPKRFYEALAEYAADDKQKAALERLASPEGAAELKKRAEENFENYVDTLREFDSAHPPISLLVELIAPLKRREYSIASSQRVHPNAVHLLIVVVDWKNPKTGETRYGQTSKFLADLHQGAEVTVSVKPSVMKLPTDPKAPVIMAGLGTGLAPFKAFLEEKMWQRDQGHEIGEVFLFLGSRHQRQEYLYGELFEAYKNAGILTHIGAAFSRDQAEKIYIQHRIAQAKEQLIDAFVVKNGTFYLCGPTWPVPDVSAALSDIVATEAATRNEKVDEDKLIEELKDKERYILEVY